MQVIVSHMNTDFDALASMYAAKKLYPNAHVVLPGKLETKVKQFMNVYRDVLDYKEMTEVRWEQVTSLIIVDVASVKRISNEVAQLDLEDIEVTLFDHHPPRENDVEADNHHVESVGAAVTILIEKMMDEKLDISAAEATLFGLGIYTDTKFFTNDTTTARDFQAATYLMENGMSLELIQQYGETALLPEQQTILNDLFGKMDVYKQDGLQIVVATASYNYFQGGLAAITERLLDISNVDVVLSVVGMKNHVHIVGRASADRVNLLPLLEKWQGGGHEKAGSAIVKRAEAATISAEVVASLPLIYAQGMVARDIMTTPVKTIPSDTTMEEAGRQMYRYGHSGYPVVDDDKLVGIITRRDLDKAIHHGLGHAPVKAYMSTNVLTIDPDKSMEEIHQLIIDKNVGRLPVIENGELIGIVTRTNIIRILQQLLTGESDDTNQLKTNISSSLQEQLDADAYRLLQKISRIATEEEINVFLIGGIVRDLFLQVPNDDIDIVVEGDGIHFAQVLQEKLNGKLMVHENFGTATWETIDGFSIDIATSRLEYYEKPGALPLVESSNVDEDLFRRDFTMNAMAICLTGDRFGQLVDPFNGQADILEKRLTILHNLSFVEDPTRILRAVRFEARFDFRMDEQTENLAFQSIENMREISTNRLRGELNRIYTESNPLFATGRLFHLGFWQLFAVPLEQRTHTIQHMKKMASFFNTFKETEPSAFQYIAMVFFTDTIPKEINNFIATRKEKKFVQDINNIGNHKALAQAETVGELHAILKSYDLEVIMFLMAADEWENENLLLQYLKQRKKWQPLITGADLIRFGLQPNAHFSSLLLELEIAAFNGEITSKDDAYAWLKKHRKI